jgi:hypothetical protein
MKLAAFPIPMRTIIEVGVTREQFGFGPRCTSVSEIADALRIKVDHDAADSRLPQLIQPADQSPQVRATRRKHHEFIEINDDAPSSKTELVSELRPPADNGAPFSIDNLPKRGI